MRKFLTIIFTLVFMASPAAIAEGDLWDNYGDQNVYGKQQAISDEEFDKALDQKLNKRKKRNKNRPRGDEFHQANETEMLKATEEEPVILCISVPISLGKNTVLPIGHYQVEGEKKDGKAYIKLYQAHYLIAKLPATETNNDFNKDTVHFVDLLENGDKQVKIIFGSLDFNAYSVVDIAE